MALSKPSSNIDKDLQCPLCSDELRLPKILKCLHTFCEQCISGYIVSLSRNKKQKITEFNCPVCRTVCTPPDPQADIDKWGGLLKSNDVIGTFSAIERGETIEFLCGPCTRMNGKGEPITWCLICQEALCVVCDNFHKNLKISLSHRVVPFKDYYTKLRTLDIHAILNRCTEHPGKEQDSFCFRHKKTACTSCRYFDHKDCPNVLPIEAIVENDVRYQNTSECLKNIEKEALKILGEKEEQKGELKASVQNAEDKAVKFIEKLKCKLDSLYESDIKQLHVLEEESNAELNVEIRLLEQVIKSLKHWNTVMCVVKDLGNTTQQFLIFETVRHQLEVSIKELTNKMRKGSVLGIDFKESTKLAELEATESVCKFSQHTKLQAFQLHSLFSKCEPLGIKFIFFDTIQVEFDEKFHQKGNDFSCGACVGNNCLVLGSKSKNELKLIDKQSGNILKTIPFNGNCCRMCYSNNTLCISLFQKDYDSLFRCSVTADAFGEIENLSFNSDYVGDMVEYNDKIFIIVDEAIKSFPIMKDSESADEMVTCFETNTDCGINGLGLVDGESLVYTTKNMEIKKTSMNGTEEFCYKHDEIKKPEGIAVLPFGEFLVLDRSDHGSIFILSADGTKHRKLLDGFKFIKKVYDMWLDNDYTKFYVVGGEFVEVYNIL